jgi:predicted Zn-dependent protease
LNRLDRRSRPQDEHRSRVIALLLIDVGLVALTLAVYGQAWDFGLIVFDDPTYVVSNPPVTSGLSFSGVSWAFRTFYGANWIPLTWLSLMADVSLYGNWAGGFHITNVLLHACNVLLLFHVLNRATGQRGPSAFVAALFAVHPIHAESVVWITERKDVLSMFFGLWSLWFYVRYAQERRYALLGASIVGLCASLMAKQTFVTLPFVFLLLDFWPLARLNGGQIDQERSSPEVGRQRTASLILEKLPFFILVLAICAVTLVAQTAGPENVSDPAPLSLRLANALVAYVSYLGKAIVPIHLGILYPFEADVNLIAAGAAAALLVVLTILAITFWRRFPFLLVGWLWFLGTLVPMIGVVKVGRQQMADRYAYLSFIGLYIAVAWTFATLLHSRRLKVSLAVVSLAFYGAMGFLQVSYWRDGLTLMQHTYEVTRDNSFCRDLLAYELNAQGRGDEALEEMRAAIKLDPHNPEPYTRMADLLLPAGRIDEAASAYRSALALQENNVDARAGLGWTYLQQKKPADAKREFARAVEADPNLGTVRFYLAYVCRLMGDYEESNRHCRSALAIEPDMPACRRLMADNFDSLGRPAEAAEIRATLPVQTTPTGPGSGSDQSGRPSVPSVIR